MPEERRKLRVEPEPTARPAPPWRFLFLLLLASRGFIYAVAAVALPWAPKGPFYTPPRSALDWLFRWDAAWFASVVDRGYFFSHVGEPTNVVFLPAYPMLVRAASVGGLLNVRLMGYVVALVGLWVALAQLWKLTVADTGDERAAKWTLAFLCFGPVSFFFSTWYSESWFLAFSLSCLVAAKADRWGLAFACGALAGLTRFVGIVLIVPLVWSWWEDRPKRCAVPGLRELATFVSPAAGFGAYAAWLWFRFGDPLLYFHAEENWGAHFTWFWGLFASKGFASLSVGYELWFAAALLTAFALIIAGVWLRVRTAWLLYALGLCALYISARSVQSLPRYLSVVFPLYLSCGLLARRWPRAGAAMLAISAGAEAVCIALFVNGYWFT